MAGLLDDYRELMRQQQAGSQGMQPNLPSAMGQMPDMSALNQAGNLARLNQAANQAPPPQQPRSFGDRAMGILGAIGGGIRKRVQDPNFADRLVIGLGGMTMNPNQAAMQQAAANIENRRAMDLLGKQANQTAEWLKNQPGGEPYARLLVDNPTLKATDVIAMYNADKSKKAFKILTGDQIEQTLGISGYDPSQLFEVSSEGQIKPAEVSAKPEDSFEQLTVEEANNLGLPKPNEKSYQRNVADNRVYEIGGGGINIGNATEGERKLGNLANRLEFAQGQISQVLGMSPESNAPAMIPSVLKNLGLAYLSNVLNPAERRIIEAAQRDMLDAALTIGTGAAYTAEQIEGYRESYFPQMGDDEATIQAKNSRLQNLISGALESAGRGRIGGDETDQQPQDQNTTATVSGSQVTVREMPSGITRTWSFPTEEQAQQYASAISGN